MYHIGRFLVWIAQPLIINEGMIVAMERAGKNWALSSIAYVLPYLPRAEGCFQQIDGAETELDHASKKAGSIWLLFSLMHSGGYFWCLKKEFFIDKNQTFCNLIFYCMCKLQTTLTCNQWRRMYVLWHSVKVVCF